MAYKVEDIAKKILALATRCDADGLICHRKLQILLYYNQAFHLAYFNEDLFEDELEAWVNGPAVPLIHEIYAKYDKLGISFDGDVIFLETKEERLFDEVYRIYGQYSVSALMNMTHAEKPWKNTSTGIGNVIDKKIMKQFFKNRFK